MTTPKPSTNKPIPYWKINEYYKNNPTALQKKNDIRYIIKLLQEYQLNPVYPPNHRPRYMYVIPDFGSEAFQYAPWPYTPRRPTNLEIQLWPNYYTEFGPYQTNIKPTITINQNSDLKKIATNIYDKLKDKSTIRKTPITEAEQKELKQLENENPHCIIPTTTEPQPGTSGYKKISSTTSILNSDTTIEKPPTTSNTPQIPKIDPTKILQEDIDTTSTEETNEEDENTSAENPNGQSKTTSTTDENTAAEDTSDNIYQNKQPINQVPIMSKKNTIFIIKFYGTTNIEEYIDLIENSFYNETKHVIENNTAIIIITGFAKTDDLKKNCNLTNQIADIKCFYSYNTDINFWQKKNKFLNKSPDHFTKKRKLNE